MFLWNLSREYVSVSWKVKMSSGYLQPDIRRFSNMKTLVLLDGIPFDDHETILN